MIYIDDLIGIPYKKGGNDKQGFDCYGFVKEVCKRAGKTLPDLNTENLENVDISVQGFDFIKSNLEKINKPSKECDLVLIKDAKGIMSHIGVYLDGGYIAHCNKSGCHLDKLSRIEFLIGSTYRWLK